MKLNQNAKLDECVLGIEPNEHQIPCFQGKYSYHTDHSENPERLKASKFSIYHVKKNLISFWILN